MYSAFDRNEFKVRHAIRTEIFKLALLRQEGVLFSKNFNFRFGYFTDRYDRISFTVEIFRSRSESYRLACPVPWHLFSDLLLAICRRFTAKTPDTPRNGLTSTLIIKRVHLPLALIIGSVCVTKGSPCARAFLCPLPLSPRPCQRRQEHAERAQG